jgi:glutamate-1-semialdehyde 2,1-aminomutase/spore coat polysaccharide biosynthesis protein SpsF
MRSGTTTISASRSIARSTALKARAARRIPTLAQTFSKAPSQYVQGVAPVYLERGAGSHVWDVDGNEYIDYPMALGPVILGHNEPAITQAAIAQLERGIAFSLPHPLELELSELLCDLIPCAEMVRFGKNGSDVTSGAVRAARAYTGRDLIACCGYHGWQDWFIGTTTRHRGVPEAVRALTKTFTYNDLGSLERIFAEHPGDVAAVILEPVGVVEPAPGFLEGVRDLAHRHGALLIFDEVVTGFRLDLGGAQARYGVTPDLACFGKAMGNGFPIAAVVGRAEVMAIFDEIFFSFTFAGDALALAAALATIRFLRDEPVIPHLWAQGAALKQGYNQLAAELGLARSTECLGLPPRTVILFRDEQGAESLAYKTLFQQECLKRGVLFSGSQNLCYRHSDDDIATTLAVYRIALEILAEAIAAGDVLDRLEGPVVEPVFRRA